MYGLMLFSIVIGVVSNYDEMGREAYRLSWGRYERCDVIIGFMVHYDEKGREIEPKSPLKN